MVIGTVFKTIGRTYMDVTLRSGPNLTVRIMERPGQWMDAEALAKLSAQLRQVAGRTLDAGTLTYGVFSGDSAHMGAVIITLVSRRDGTPVAFNALAIMDLNTTPHPTQVLHLGLVMVDPDERSKNLSWVLYGLTCFLFFVRRQFRPVWISKAGVFKFDTDRPNRWKLAQDVWISGLFAAGYADDMVQVAEFDLEQKTIRTVQPTLYGFQGGKHWRAADGWSDYDAFGTKRRLGECGLSSK